MMEDVTARYARRDLMDVSVMKLIEDDDDTMMSGEMMMLDHVPWT
jgi:hypothetical protein